MESKPKYRRIIIWALIIVVFFWALTFFMLKLDEDSRGPIGDMFGVVNALFSGLAFAGIILTIYMQREELTLQRKELEETRGVFEKQSLIMSNQQNDAQFFNLLENHRQMVHSFDKKRNHYQRAGGGQRIYNKELESGYQFLSNIAEMWQEYLSVYSDMHKFKTLYKTELLRYSPIEVIYSDENIRSYVNETTHLSEFVIRKFGGTTDFEFYNDTLSNSLLESEKFILSACYDIVKKNKESSPFGLDVYNRYEFIDFDKFSLPQLEINLIDRGFFNQNYFEFKFNGILLSYYSIIDFHSENPPLTNLEIKGSNINSDSGSFTLNMIDYLKGTSLKIETIPVPNEKLKFLQTRDYYVIFEIIHIREKFYIPIKFEIESREDYDHKLNVDEKLYTLNFKWNNPDSILRDRAVELVERVKNHLP